MPGLRRLTVDNVIKMAGTAARRHIDAPTGSQPPSEELINAIACTWELVKGRLGQTESAALGTLIDRIVGKR